MTKKKDTNVMTETSENVENTTEEATKTANEEVVAPDDDADNTPAPLPPNMVEVKRRPWLKYVITAGVLAVLTVLTAWARGAFSATEMQDVIGYWCDAFSVPGLITLCIGLLVVASNGGVFDMLVYGVVRLFALFKKDPVDRKYGGYYEYQQSRRAKKRPFWFLVIVGGAYLLVGIILLVVYFQL